MLAPRGRFVSLTHDWAIEKHEPLPAWRERVERDAGARRARRPDVVDRPLPVRQRRTLLVLTASAAA